MTPAERKAAMARARLRMRQIEAAEQKQDGILDVAGRGILGVVLLGVWLTLPYFASEWVVILCRYVLPALVVVGWIFHQWLTWRQCKDAEGLE
jgi:hypothetical protein